MLVLTEHRSQSEVDHCTWETQGRFETTRLKCTRLRTVLHETEAEMQDRLVWD